MIYSILQVSTDSKSFLTASFRHFTLCGILQERSLTWNNESLKAAPVRRAMIRFVRKGSWFVVTLITTYSETDSVNFKDANL